MYGYRQHESALMTNLNSISSSLSSIDTVGRRTNNGKASVDNLIGGGPRSNHSIASTSLLWRNTHNNSNKNGHNRYNNNNNNNLTGTLSSTRGGGGGGGGSRYQGSEIYYSGNASRARGCCRKFGNNCINSEIALNFILVPLLLLTITRQVFDFLGQIWLQILINFFTIILIIVALFGIRQHRISYLSLFALWSLFNTTWNIIVICIHTKIRDVGLNEDVLSFYTGTTSWWHSNGPGCLPYNISSIQPSINILKPITGCRIDYHLIESAQAALHALLSLISALICCFVMSNVRKNPAYSLKGQPNADKLYRLNNLVNDRSKVNQNPFPSNGTSRHGPHSASLRRAPNKTSSRSSRHSVSSMRSSRQRNRQSIGEGTLPTPRGSTSSMSRSQKYGSLSSRRNTINNKKSIDRRSDISSLTYGTTSGVDRGAGTSQRTRLSSLSSADYLPSYQPPHSSSANLLSSYGEITSIDSYNNHGGQRGAKNRQTSIKSMSKGATNPTYNGSRSSICSHNPNTNPNGNNLNNNNYDDLSYIYGNSNARTSESLYGPASSTATTDNIRHHNQQIYQQGRTNSIGRRTNGFKPRDQQQQQQQNGIPQQIQAETYQTETYQNGDTMTKAKMSITNGSGIVGSFHSFSIANQHAAENGRSNELENRNTMEINNNNNQFNYQDQIYDKTPHTNDVFASGNSLDNRSRAMDGSTNHTTVNQHQIYASRSSRHPIYSNHTANGNSETPI